MFRKNQRFILYCLYIYALAGCYTRKEGCLDTLATNYDVTADDACINSCCLYPRLTLTLLHQWGDSVLSPSDMLVNEAGQYFRLTDVRCYVSSVSLHNRSGSTNQTVTFLSRTDGQTVPDDFLLLRLADKTLTGPQFRMYGETDSITIQTGLTEEIADASWETLPETHVLSPKNQLKTRDNALASLIIKVTLMRIGQEDLPLSFALKAGIHSEKTVFPIALTTKKGDNIPIPFHLDYSALLKNVDFTKKEEEVVSLLSQNLGQFLFVK